MQAISTEDFELLLETNRLLSSKLELADLVRSIMEMASRVMKVEAGSALLLDEKKNELYFDVAIGGAGEKIKGARLPVGRGIAGWVAQEGKAAIVNDVTKDSRWKPDLAGKHGFETKNILACPLQVKGRIIGVVEAINKKDGSQFNVVDLKLFEAFASQAAVAIENARLFAGLRSEKRTVEEIFNQMADGAMLTDKTGEILRLNNRAAAWFCDIKVRHLQDFDAQGYLWDPDPEGLSMSPAKSGRLEIRRAKPQLFILSGTWARLEDSSSGDSQMIFVFRDVTQARHEEILQKNFLSVISHKLRTPLVAITGYIPFLRQDLDKLTPHNQRALDAVDKESRHLAYLIEDLLRFTTVSTDAGQTKLAQNKAKAARLIEDAFFKIALLIDGEKVSVAKKLDPEAQVVGDTVMLIDMLKNLMENAIRFNAKPYKMLKLEVESAGGFVKFRVADNGPGIPPEEREKVFQWFHQVEEYFTGQVRGMGLGLAFVKKVVELHKGSVELSSRVGEGTTFTVSLPAAP
ncbi:MAG: GAF domain-containing sensor histidine kinase [Elusimicrobia bacterium]|nr:GAF domain-containing sensor histidine kinase [Elusimicrobiota bacterium]